MLYSWTVNIHRKYKLQCLLKSLNKNKRKENSSPHEVHVKSNTKVTILFYLKTGRHSSSVAQPGEWAKSGMYDCAQVGYFWTTLVVMCALYSGIYRVALNLQRKSEAKHRKTAELVMAGGEMSRLGTGVLQQQQQQPGSSDAAADEDGETTAHRRGGRLLQPASKRQRPKQLSTTTTVLLSPRPNLREVLFSK